MTSLPTIAWLGALLATVQPFSRSTQLTAHVQLVASQGDPYAAIHHPPIGPGRPCDSASISDPHIYLICTNDRLAEDWLTLNQAGYALRHQLGDNVYFPLMRPEGAAAWDTLKKSCPLTLPMTAVANSNTVPCIEAQIRAARNKTLERLTPMAAEEAQRDIRMHIRLQAALGDLNYLSGPADGSYGPATRDAITRFQRDNGIPTSGFMTDLTGQTLLQTRGSQIAQSGLPPQPGSDASVPPSSNQASRPPVKRHETPAMRQLVSDHSSRAVVLLLNIAADAPNASLTLAGEPTFANQKTSFCQKLGNSADNLDREAVDAWFHANNLNVSTAGVSSCTGQSLHQLDGVFASTDTLDQLDPALFNELAEGLENGTVRKFDILSVVDRRKEEDELTAARSTTNQDLESDAPGFGYIAFEGSGQVACIIASGSADIWRDVLSAHATELGRDLGYPFSPSIVLTDADTAYARARRHECRLIVGKAEQLKLVRSAATRDHLSVTMGVLWLTPEALETAARTLDQHQREAAQTQERARQAAEDQRVLDAERARRTGEVSDAKTRELRSTYRENATALQNQVTENLVALLKRSARDVQSQEAGGLQSQEAENARKAQWVAALFPEVAAQSRARTFEDWEFVSVDSDTFEYGRSKWNDRTLETIVIQEKIKERNAEIGRYEDLCYLLAFQNDAEFSRIRSPHSFDCEAGGRSALQDWLTSIAFTSQWNASP